MECFFLRAALQTKLEYLLHDKQGLAFTYSHTMKDKEFYLSAEIKYNCLDVIKMWGTDFELKVYSLTDTDYVVAENSIELYGNGHPGLYAFEVSLDDELSYAYMEEAIRWYAVHIGKPELEIIRTDPRADALTGNVSE